MRHISVNLFFNLYNGWYFFIAVLQSNCKHKEQVLRQGRTNYLTEWPDQILQELLRARNWSKLQSFDVFLNVHRSIDLFH